MSFIFEEETYAIRGALFEVYKEMGSGFLEAVYQECLEKELRKSGIPFIAQPELQLMSKDEPLQQTYKHSVLSVSSVVKNIRA